MVTTASSAAADAATADAATTDGTSRFWCHECARHVATRDADDGSGELCCAACGGNFVEEVEADDPPEQFLAAPAAAGSAGATQESRPDEPATDAREIHEGFGPREPSNDAAARVATPRTPPSGASNAAGATAGEAPSPLTELLQQLVSGGGAAAAGGARTARIIRRNGTPVEFYVTSSGDGGMGELGGGGLFGLLAGAMSGPFGGGGFVGNPGDYALGPNHLSQLINQLMQNDPNRHGAPPAAKEVVEKLPSHKVEQREVDANAECAVCKDLFAVDDDAKDLPCAHSFHPDCITPWLKMHNSCPVCRFELPTDDQDYEERRRHEDHHEHHHADQASAGARW